MKNFVLVLLFICSSTLAMSQKISGVVLDKEGRGIEYVNIGILNGTIGTISNEKGEFKITLPDSLNHRILRFSRLGYTACEWSVEEFKKLSTNIITLDDNEIKIQDISVRAKSHFKETVINQRGIRIPGGIAAMQEQKIAEGEYIDVIGCQFGNIIESDKQYIPQSLELTVTDCSVDSLLLRVNIYDIDEKNQVTAILNSSEIYFTIYKSSDKKVYTIDLTTQILTLKGKKYFGLEIVDYSYPTGQHGIVACFPLYKSQSFRRDNSQGRFSRFSYNYGMKIKALIEK